MPYRKLKIGRLVFAVTGLALAICSKAAAFDSRQLEQGGSLPLNEIKPLIEQSETLKQEVEHRLATTKASADSVICVGKRFPRQWHKLGGARVSPYRCEFADKWLIIRATVRLTSSAGRRYESTSREAMKNASTISEANPSWQWDDRTAY
jgi:hypothetical protein